MKVLVLSGGASKGSFQVGALKYLIQDLNISYDGFAGISVGAINTASLAMYSKSQEKEGFANLLNFWNNLSTDKIYKNWCIFGRVAALWKKSLYNSKPLIDLIHSNLDLNKIRSSGRKISVGAVSLTSGNYRSFTQDDDCFVDGVLASSAFPAALCPIQVGNELYSDGGLKNITPTAEAIKMGATEIDVIICSPIQTTTCYNNSDKTINLALRSVDLITDQINYFDLKIAQQYNQLALLGATDKKYIKINIIRPNLDLTTNSLDFSQTAIQKMINIGYEDAKSQFKL